MFDLHCHILPGIDDGANSWQESMDMARMAAQDGVRTVVATPHCSCGLPPDKIISLVDELNRRIAEQK
ncbi:MAG TPA: CpsB/CapC family capsule biosynthesis tyrosine phosphatase, partial [Verrucomicrobiae bacterium]|nr:CpsB/CapC family capsule biosynthesis tyrosine phosphatase [Verrucomicrobiae bacterium]